MLEALRAYTNDSLISGTHPSVHECLFGGFFVVQIAQHDTRASDHQLAWRVIRCDFLVFRRHDACLDSREQGTG